MKQWREIFETELELMDKKNKWQGKEQSYLERRPHRSTQHQDKVWDNQSRMAQKWGPRSLTDLTVHGSLMSSNSRALNKSLLLHRPQ